MTPQIAEISRLPDRYPVTDLAQSAPTARTRSRMSARSIRFSELDTTFGALEDHQVGEHEDGDQSGEGGGDAREHAGGGRGEPAGVVLDLVLVVLDQVQ